MIRVISDFKVLFCHSTFSFSMCNDQDTDCVIRVTAATPRRQSNPTPSHTFRARHKVPIFDIVATIFTTMSISSKHGVMATFKVDHSLGATPLEAPEGGGYQSGTIQAGAWEDVVLLTQEGATSNQLGRRSPPAVAAVESQNQFLTEVDTDAAQVCSITDC